MRGVWYTTGGTSLAVVAVAAIGAAMGIEAAQWLLARIWWILGITALCAALATAAALRLMRWNEARAAAVWASRERLSVTAEAVPSVTAHAAPRAAENHVHYEIHVHGGDGEAAAAVRAVLPGTVPVTEREPRP